MKNVSSSNIFCKYADDADLIVPENSETSLETEFANVCDWATKNKMVINLNKTKEIVFHKPNPRLFLMPKAINGIEQVFEAKMLGVTFKGNFKFDDHVKEILSVCSQRLYLLKQFKNQGLCLQKLDIIFQALIVSKISYGLAAWGGGGSLQFTLKIK